MNINIMNNVFHNLKSRSFLTKQKKTQFGVSFCCSDNSVNSKDTEKIKGYKNVNSLIKKRFEDSPNNKFNSFQSFAEKVKLPQYVAPDIKDLEVRLVNESRTKILNDWFSAFEKISREDTDSDLLKKYLSNPSLRLFVMNSISSNLKDSNRIIPPPFSKTVLEKTLSSFLLEENNSSFQSHMSKSNFLSEYNSNLIDNTLDYIINYSASGDFTVYDVEGKEIPTRYSAIKNHMYFVNPKLYLSHHKYNHGNSRQVQLQNNHNDILDLNSVWVKVHKSRRKNPSSEVVSAVERLSNPNWCTRSRYDNASDVLKDGSFYILLERNKHNKWVSKAAIAMNHGKISQIQGKNNDNSIPVCVSEKINKLLHSINAISVSPNSSQSNMKNINCRTGYSDEMPYAYTQLQIAKRLSSQIPNNSLSKSKTLSGAIRMKDNFAIFKALFPSKDVNLLSNGKLSISSYVPFIHINKFDTIPISMLGVNEDSLLKDVEEVKSNLLLNNSTITQFPPSLKNVGGVIILSLLQYEEFKNILDSKYSYDIENVSDSKGTDMICIRNLKLN